MKKPKTTKADLVATKLAAARLSALWEASPSGSGYEYELIEWFGGPNHLVLARVGRRMGSRGWDWGALNGGSGQEESREKAMRSAEDHLRRFLKRWVLLLDDGT